MPAPVGCAKACTAGHRPATSCSLTSVPHADTAWGTPAETCPRNGSTSLTVNSGVGMAAEINDVRKSRVQSRRAVTRPTRLSRPTALLRRTVPPKVWPACYIALVGGTPVGEYADATVRSRHVGTDR